MSKSFKDFLKAVAHRLRGIARKLRGDLTATDLQGDAWIAADEIAAKRGTPVDFDDPSDQELVLNQLYWNAKRQNDWRLKAAHSIDDDTEGAIPWADRLAAPGENPEKIVLQREADLLAAQQFADSYSQAAAYYIAIYNFPMGREDLSDHLAISSRALNQRIDSAASSALRQHSVFDKVSRIDPDFVPLARDWKASNESDICRSANNQQFELNLH